MEIVEKPALNTYEYFLPCQYATKRLHTQRNRENFKYVTWYNGQNDSKKERRH